MTVHDGVKNMSAAVTKNPFETRPDGSGGEIHSVTFYNEYWDKETQHLVEDADFSALPQYKGKSPDEWIPELNKAFDDNKIDVLLTTVPQELLDFRDYLRSIISLDVLHRIIAFWPPVVPIEKPEERALVLWLVKLVRQSAHPHRILHWIGREICAGDYASMENSILAAISLCKLKGKTKKGCKSYWAMIDKEGEFTLTKIEETSLECARSVKIDSISVDKGIVTVSRGPTKVSQFVPVDEGKALLWSRALARDKNQFPLMFGSIERPLPGELLCSFYEAVTSTDMIVAKVLVSYEVTKVTAEGYPAMDALLDVFAYAGKVNQLLQVLVGYEMGKPEVTNNTVLRTNCNLTNMFKVFFARYGKGYYEKVIKRAILHVDKHTDVHWTNPEGSLDKAFSIVLAVMKLILESGPLVPPQLRHMASVLKHMTALRFNDKQATYNALSGFFLLRFVNGMIVDQRQVDPGFQPKSDLRDSLVPFTQVMQYIFNLIPFYGKMEMLEPWNDKLIKHVFPKLMSWVMTMAEYQEDAVYDPPDESRLTAALEMLIGVVSRSQKNFERIYRQSAAVQHEWTVSGWSFSTFLASHFKQNENNRISQTIPDN